MADARRGADPRLAAGRARALGLPTRGTTNPNRLRRMDNWIVAHARRPCARRADPLVVDLGYGATPVTAVELAARLARVRPDVRVLGLEIDPERVAGRAAGGRPAPADLRARRLRAGRARARRWCAPPTCCASTTRPAAAGGVADRCARTWPPGGLLVEGTCDELGRRGCWVLLDARRPADAHVRLPASSTSSGRADLAERLPKALIHHNVAGPAGARAAARLRRGLGRRGAAVGRSAPRQRWTAACAGLADAGWPVDVTRARHGELTVPWAAVAPV